jgi:hypothetical protein
MDAPREGLDGEHVARSGRAVVLLRLPPVAACLPEAGCGQNVVDIAVLQLLVDRDVVVVQDLGVDERLQDGLLQNMGKEGVLVGRLVAADERLQALLLAQHPVKQADAALVEVERVGGIYGLVQWELYALDEVEGDGVFEPSVIVSCSRVDGECST